jgi:hypothetical protein
VIIHDPDLCRGDGCQGECADAGLFADAAQDTADQEADGNSKGS